MPPPPAAQSSVVSCRVLITAGPTHEPIDAVRYIANRSSGRVGIALAEAAATRGMPTTLLLGPTHLRPDPVPEVSSLLRTIRFQTTDDLQSLLKEHWPAHDVLFMAAAVADYRLAPSPGIAPADRSSKIPRQRTGLALHLEPTPDLLAELASSTRPDQYLIGFALEPRDRLLESARAKRERKRLDAIIANPLETMDSEAITAMVIFADGEEVAAPPGISKREFAEWLLGLAESKLLGRPPVARLRA
jgi:phosphopantothenoylcysteine decarboxylase / phosphopantothenate---cysteine ligase